MKKILCPTDFSEAAHDAVVYAAKLSQKIGAELILFNVRSLTEKIAERVVYGEDVTFSRIKQELEAQSLEVTREFKVSCSAEVETSGYSLAKVIEQRAEGCDLIVMGTNGADDLYQFFTGSNTYKVIRKSQIPVMIIPQGTGYGDIKKIVYAFNYLREQTLPLDQILTFVNLLKCEMSVLQVMEEARSSVVDKELRDLQFLISASHPETKLEFHTIRSSDIAQSINSYILRNQIDVLALYAGHKNFLEKIFQYSVIRSLSSVSNFPVLVFHH